MSGDMTRATEKAWHTEIPACVSSLGSRGTPERRAEEISEDLIRGLEKPGFARARIMERTPLPEITQPVNGEKALLARAAKIMVSRLWIRKKRFRSRIMPREAGNPP